MNPFRRWDIQVAAVVAFLAGVLIVLNSPRRSAPDFSAKTLDGETFTKQTLKGKVVLVQFWATWCGYCRGDQPAVDAVAREFSNQGLVVLAVNASESRDKVQQYLEQSPRACNIVANEDSNLAAVFRPDAYPMYVLIDKDGNIAGTQNGAGGEESLRHLLSKAGLKSG
jgi:thiol-disulfide isomerase/thioredoxin